MEATISMPSCCRAGNFSGSPLRHPRLQAASSRWPIAFDRLCENSETPEAVEEGHHVSLPFESVIPK
jgi:hypothetical protein